MMISIFHSYPIKIYNRLFKIFNIAITVIQYGEINAVASI